jgi:4'-phosphopantetheinyl transferase
MERKMKCDDPDGAPWNTAPGAVPLSSGEIHIWRAEPNSSSLPLDQYHRLLSPEERRRAERYHFDGDRNRFIFRRGVLRTILGLYTKTPPAELFFNFSRRGKPELADGVGTDKIKFNLSFSNGLALFSFARDQEIGIDIEYIRQVPEIEEISLRFFATFENYALRALPETRRKDAFFSIWTRKEAFIKATGDGMSCPLNKFCVSLAPGGPYHLLSIEGKPEESSLWSIIPFAPAARYAAALAVRSRSYQLRYWKWEDDILGLKGNSNG